MTVLFLDGPDKRDTQLAVPVYSKVVRLLKHLPAIVHVRLSGRPVGKLTRPWNRELLPAPPCHG